MKVLTVAEMQRVERLCAGMGISSDMLMENAGRAAAAEIERITGGVLVKRIIVLIGPGNNGGDGLAAARHLHEGGAKVGIFAPERKSDDAKLEEVIKRSIEMFDGFESLEKHLASADAVIDAFFGTGRGRTIGGAYKTALEAAARARKNNSRIKVIALDVPSGLDADTGECDPSCLRADYTITLGFPKRGLFNPPGSGFSGKIIIADIGIPENLAADIKIEIIMQTWARQALPERRLDANKGDFGRVLVVAGSANYTGAAYLAASGAMRTGAGLVHWP